MSIQRGNLKELYELSNMVEELDRRVLEAIKMAEERGLMQVARVLGTIKSYVDLLRRELEVKDQL
jgi:DNA-directed RNA polymerase specialized sigma subunit